MKEHQRRATIRSGLKVSVITVLSAGHAASNVPDPLFAVVGLLALAKRELPSGPLLSYLDEASWFMLIACLGRGPTSR